MVTGFSTCALARGAVILRFTFAGYVLRIKSDSACANPPPGLTPAVFKVKSVESDCAVPLKPEGTPVVFNVKSAESANADPLAPDDTLVVFRVKSAESAKVVPPIGSVTVNVA